VRRNKKKSFLSGEPERSANCRGALKRCVRKHTNISGVRGVYLWVVFAVEIAIDERRFADRVTAEQYDFAIHFRHRFFKKKRNHTRTQAKKEKNKSIVLHRTTTTTQQQTMSLAIRVRAFAAKAASAAKDKPAAAAAAAATAAADATAVDAAAAAAAAAAASAPKEQRSAFIV
jgi:hypothetical protein